MRVFLVNYYFTFINVVLASQNINIRTYTHTHTHTHIPLKALEMQINLQQQNVDQWLLGEEAQKKGRR